MGERDGAKHRVVILGGGFGGLYAAQALGRAPAEVVVIDRRNFHLFQPLLYQVATGALSPANIASPIRGVLARRKNTRVLLAEAVGIDAAGRRVILSDGEQPYDTLIVAAGVSHNYFGHAEWEEHAPGLKTVEDATEIRRRILLAFEAAERETDPEARQARLTFVVVGAGPTGVELAGAIGEIARYTVHEDFRAIDTRTAKIYLVEGGERVLPSYPAKLSAKAQRALEKLGVTVLVKTTVTDVGEHGVTLRRAEGSERLHVHTVLWAAGVQASPLGRVVAEAAGAKADRVGRVIVEPDLTVPGHPEIFVIGDLANFPHQSPDGAPLPGVAPVAMQQGKYAAGLIRRRLAGKAPEKHGPFRYWNRGSMATIGRAAAVAEIGRLRFSGLLAWLMWLFVHILFLIEYENRFLVMFQWAASYFTRGRAARLITGEPAVPFRFENEMKAPKDGRPRTA